MNYPSCCQAPQRLSFVVIAYLPFSTEKGVSPIPGIGVFLCIPEWERISGVGEGFEKWNVESTCLTLVKVLEELEGWAL